MPTYEYMCKHCSWRFEQYQSINDDELIHCPSCDQDGLERLCSAVPAHDHTSGFTPKFHRARKL